MNQFMLIVIIGSLVVILFDTLASFASRQYELNYGKFSIVSFSIYSLVGFFAVKSISLVQAIAATGIVGLVDSTIGWYISWIIGPGRPQIEMNLKNKFIAIVFITMLASLSGFIGGLVSLLINSDF